MDCLFGQGTRTPIAITLLVKKPHPIGPCVVRYHDIGDYLSRENTLAIISGGIGPLTAVTILAELGDARRFSSSRDAVRYAGLDITVKQSDQRRSPGHLSLKGANSCVAPLRWALEGSVAWFFPSSTEGLVLCLARSFAVAAALA